MKNAQEKINYNKFKLFFVYQKQFKTAQAQTHSMKKKKLM